MLRISRELFYPCVFLVLMAGCGEKPGVAPVHAGVSIKIEDAGDSGTKIKLWHHATGEAKLYNAKVKMTLTYEDGRSEQLERFWAGWDYDKDTKIVELSSRKLEKVEVHGEANNGDTKYNIVGYGSR